MQSYKLQWAILEGAPSGFRKSLERPAEAPVADKMAAKSEALDETWASVVAIDVKMVAPPPAVSANEQVTSLGQVESSSPARRANSSKGRFKRKRRQRIQKPGSEKPSRPSEAATSS